MKANFKIILLFAVVISACQKINKNDGRLSEAPWEEVSGFLIFGNEVSDFIECKDTSLTFWVNDETGEMDSLYKVYSGKEYEPVYVQMEALKLPPDPLGYASERDGLIRVRKIFKMEKENAVNKCLSDR